MQRAELHELLALGHVLGVHLDGVLEDFAAVENAMADGIDVLGIAEIGHDLLQGLGVVGGAARADTLHKALRQTGVGRHVEELVFERTRS